MNSNVTIYTNIKCVIYWKSDYDVYKIHKQKQSQRHLINIWLPFLKKDTYHCTSTILLLNTAGHRRLSTKRFQTMYSSFSVFLLSAYPMKINIYVC